MILKYLSGPSETDYHSSNGKPDLHSVHSSQLSVQDDPLLVRTHNQQTSQQVCQQLITLHIVIYIYI